MDDSKNSSLPTKTEAWDALTRLALDPSWSWGHSADEVWKRLDPELWELTANPWLILQCMSPRKLDALKIEVQTDAAFRQRIEQLLTKLHEKNAAPAWFQTAHPSSPQAPAPDLDSAPDHICMRHECRPPAPQVISRRAFSRFTRTLCRRKFGG